MRSLRHLPYLGLLFLLPTPGVHAQPSDPEPVVHELKSGGRWRVFSYKAAGADSARTFAAFPVSALDELEAEGILPAAEAREIRDDLAAEGLDYRQVDDVFAVDLAVAALPRTVPEKGWQSAKTEHRSWSRSDPGSYEVFSFANEHCTGSLDVGLPMSADLNMDLTYQIKTKWDIPYKWRFLEATVTGDVTVNGSVTLGADFLLALECHWKHNVFTLDIDGFWLGPVYLDFELSLDVGLDVSVKVTGEAEIRADFNGTATFEATCTSSGCEGPASHFDESFLVPEPTYEITLDANARAWMRFGVEMEIYDDDIGLVSAGATGYVEARLFGYAGNQCGDADADGSGDTLEDMLADAYVGYVVDASLSGLLLPDRDYVLAEGERPIGFWDLYDDPEGWNLADPIVRGPTSLLTGELGTWEFTTRPCYPYEDDLNLQWTGPVAGSGVLTPKTGKIVVSAMPEAGADPLTVTAVDDARGRVFNASTTWPVTVVGDTPLGDGVPENDTAGNAGVEDFYVVDVPAEATDLNVTLSGGTGNADLYVRFGQRPTVSAYNCGSTNPDNEESCSFPVPQAGRYHVLLHGAEAWSGADLTASFVDPPSTALVRDVPVDVAGGADSSTYFTLEVPSDATNLSFNLSGGTGDADIYVRFNAWPNDTTLYDCSSGATGNQESCTPSWTAPGTWYVLLDGYTAYSGASLVATYDVPVGGGEMSNGVPKTGLAGNAGSRVFYTLDVPPGASDLRFDLWGGTGDADLYVLLGSRPSASVYNCYSWEEGNDEHCSFRSPEPGRYHVLVYGYESYEGVSLMGSYVEAVVLQNGVPEDGLAGGTGSETFYVFEVPQGAADLSFVLSPGSAGTGDADLSVQRGAPPTPLDNDCRSWNPGEDRCDFAVPQAGWYHVLVDGYTDYSGWSLLAAYTDPYASTSLTNGAPASGLGGAAGSETYYTFEVPAGVTDLEFNLVGGSGDADLYVLFGLQPTLTTWDCRSWNEGNAEACAFPEPRAGTWHVLVRGYTSYSGADLTASYASPGGALSDGVAEDGLSGATDSEVFYTFEVPAGAEALSFELSGGTGDADLYVRFGAPPSTEVFDCTSGNLDNTESCVFASPQPGTYHVLVQADKSYAEASLTASYVLPIFSDGFESGDTSGWSQATRAGRSPGRR